MHRPGFRLRQAREKLGLTYRGVEKSSLEIAVKHGRPEFILHISRLADMENRHVVPSLHKLYSVSVIYHLSFAEISSWYEAPFEQAFLEGTSFPAPRTHLSAFVEEARTAWQEAESTGAEDAFATGLLAELPPALGWPTNQQGQAKGRYRYGFIGLSDRRMTPMLRPGSMVLVDTATRRIEETEWKSEYDRPMYFVELRGGYRCGWFQKRKTQLIMQPHILSRCAPEAWRTPDDAEVVGQVVGVVSYWNQPRLERPEPTPGVPTNSSGTNL